MRASTQLGCSAGSSVEPYISHPIPRPLSGKGGKNRRRGKNENEETKRELEFKEAGQEYAQVRPTVEDASRLSRNFNAEIEYASDAIGEDSPPRCRIAVAVATSYGVTSDFYLKNSSKLLIQPSVSILFASMQYFIEEGCRQL